METGVEDTLNLFVCRDLPGKFPAAPAFSDNPVQHCVVLFGFCCHDTQSHIPLVCRDILSIFMKYALYPDEVAGSQNKPPPGHGLVSVSAPATGRAIDTVAMILGKL